ncbi:MAG: adenylate/guanylate cyclase domain-containing protein [Myxococcota bacterium]
MAYLIVETRTGERTPYRLRPGRTVIGRAESCDVPILDRSLSREHAAIDVVPDGHTLTDLQSKNGTCLDGERIAGPRALEGRHLIQCGDVVVRYEAASETRPTFIDDPRKKWAPLDTLLSARRGRSVRGRDDGERLRLLLQVSEALAAPGDLGQLLERVVDLVFDLLPVDRAALFSSDGSEIRIARHRDRRPLGTDPFSQPVVDWVFRERVAGLFADMPPRESPSDYEDAIAGAMAAPLLVGEEGRLVGAFYTDRLAPAEPFTPAELALFVGFAHQVAIAIDNAQLRRRLEQAAIERTALARFFPPQTIAYLMQEGGRLEPKEVRATVLFCDISGFTSLSERLAPLEVIRLLNAYFPRVVEPVRRFEGTLEKYIGDALLAVWGAPVSRDDDAARAVRAALAMRETVAGRTWPGVDEVSVHIGVATGMVAAGNIGSSDYLQYATVGAVTNLAARICGAAGPGEIVVDDATWRAAGMGFASTPLGPTPVKGMAAAPTLFRIDKAVSTDSESG